VRQKLTLGVLEVFTQYSPEQANHVEEAIDRYLSSKA
jgi:hypothetical protein